MVADPYCGDACSAWSFTNNVSGIGFGSVYLYLILMSRIILIILISALLLEGNCRLYFTSKFGIPLTSSPKTIILNMVYPVLRENQVEATGTDRYYDILLLGSSTIQTHHQVMARILNEEVRADKPVRVTSLAMAGHTSLDQLLKYKEFDKKFEAVIFYDAINDLRANNCPDYVFKPDYSHYSVYRVLSFLDRHEFPLLIPILAQLIIQKPMEKLWMFGLVPTDKPRREWMEFGERVKSKVSYEKNLERLIKIAKSRHDRLILVTFVYSFNDYSRQDWYGYPITMWGSLENVLNGIETHNKILRKLSKKYNVEILDAQHEMPKIIKHYSGIYGSKEYFSWEESLFNDVCHFTIRGCLTFTDLLKEKLSVLERST